MNGLFTWDLLGFFPQYGAGFVAFMFLFAGFINMLSMNYNDLVARNWSTHDRGAGFFDYWMIPIFDFIGIPTFIYILTGFVDEMGSYSGILSDWKWALLANIVSLGIAIAIALAFIYTKAPKDWTKSGKPGIREQNFYGIYHMLFFTVVAYVTASFAIRCLGYLLEFRSLPLSVIPPAVAVSMPLAFGLWLDQLHGQGPAVPTLNQVIKRLWSGWPEHF